MASINHVYPEIHWNNIQSLSFHLTENTGLLLYEVQLVNAV